MGSNHSFVNDVYDEHMGLMTSYRWVKDARTVLFQLARYKFVAKMLTGYREVLEIGCADGFGSHIVAQTVQELTCIDIDKQMILDALTRPHPSNIDFVHTKLEGVAHLQFDALYALDVLEHVAPEDEDAFLHAIKIAAPVAIIGMPSKESQVYASPLSAAHHCNTKTEDEFRHTMLKYYKNVFLFGMSDEVVHTGFGPMCHYRIALCTR